MRVYCWGISDKEYEKLECNCLTFIDDVDKGALCHCGFCGKEILISENTDVCMHCGKDIIFGRFDW